MVLFRVLKINSRIHRIKAILSPPKIPPNNLFRTPKAAKSASLVSALPAKEIANTMTTNVMAKAVMFIVFSPHSKRSRQKFCGIITEMHGAIDTH